MMNMASTVLSSMRTMTNQTNIQNIKLSTAVTIGIMANMTSIENKAQLALVRKLGFRVTEWV